MAELPKISVVTPSFNQAGYLEATMQSVLEQGYPNLEYIVMDGGSTDGSAEIIQRYEKSLTYWSSAPDDGQSAAIAEGFERASGDILCWLNSDDLLSPGALWEVWDCFRRQSRTEWIVGEVCLIDARGRPLRYLSEPAWNVDWQIYVRNCVPQSSSFWRRSLYDRVEGVNRGYEIGMDYDLWFQFAHETEPYYLNKLLSFQRQHELTKTSNLQHVGVKVRPEIARKHFPEASPHSRTKHYYWRMRRMLTKSARGKYLKELVAKRSVEKDTDEHPRVRTKVVDL